MLDVCTLDLHVGLLSLDHLTRSRCFAMARRCVVVRQIVIILLGLGAFFFFILNLSAERSREQSGRLFPDLGHFLFCGELRVQCKRNQQISADTPCCCLYEVRVHSAVCRSVGVPFFRSESGHALHIEEIDHGMVCHCVHP